jgi:hypothetical protein
MHLVILGQGASSIIIVDQILQSLWGKSITKITICGQDEIAPACSLRSTAVVALRGTQTGLSPLGDELYESYHLAKEEYKKWKSVKPSPLFHLIDEDDLKAQRRFKDLTQVEETPFIFQREKRIVKKEDAFIIDTHEFFNECRIKYPQINFKKIFITQIIKDETHLRLIGLNEELKADILFLCQGAYPTFFEEAPLIPVLGSYLSFSTNFNEESFSISSKGYNLVYQAHQKRLLLGSTTEAKSFNRSPNFFELKNIFNHFIDLLPELKGCIQLDEAVIESGVRAKAKDRRMIVKRINHHPEIWIFNGFYKNGWSLPFLAAKLFLKEKTPL